ncbi:hypothetical protein RJ639_023208 [Escallonia herrerae]|uniref:GOST seven transmembrane domain-containing protein n=1 Tax=Escallonia herrerae TaxID=1293975 RepID=A0AA88V056_9ASTE|nr:hypothetical protein RJ639_023208 [Escallonia herrerae]
MKKRSLSSPGKIWLGFIVGLTYIFDYSITHVNGSIHEYQNELFIPQSNAFFFHGGSEGLYASKAHDSSSPDRPVKGKSFIRFESVIFARTRESADTENEMQSRTGLIEAIVFEVKDTERIGGAFLRSDAICCTPKLSQDGLCTVGEVIIQQYSDNPEWPKRIQTFFGGKSQEAKMVSQSVEINSTGMYYLYFMFCDPRLNGTTIRGRTVWRNPEGYLPGKMAPLMTFYGLASLAYLALGLIWFLRFVKFWKDIIQLHYHISAVIALGMCETALWYFEYANLNDTGRRPIGITIWAVTVTAVKKTLSRLLLLVVSMGYGVVRPTLGGVISKVLLLGLIYFVASEALELVEHLGNINDFAGKTKLYLVLPVAFLDASFILWIFSSLAKTLEKLQVIFLFPKFFSTLYVQTRRSMAKLELYRKFTNSLAVFVLLSIAWIGYEVLPYFSHNPCYLYFNASDPLNELWRMAWIIPAFWTLLAFSLLVVICVLWAPSHNPTRYFHMISPFIFLSATFCARYLDVRVSLDVVLLLLELMVIQLQKYAYSEETGEDFDEEAISLTSSVNMVGDMATMLERKEKGSASTDNVVSLGVDLEDDKRE